MADLNRLYEAILNGQLEPAVEVTHQIIDENLNIQKIINGYMIKAMAEIGDRF